MIFNKDHPDQSLSEVHNSVDTGKRKGWRKVFSFLGPAYLVSVGYMDPGNWATDLEGGSKYGYTLIWVLLMSNLMALLLQGLSARLGIVRGRDLAQANREEYPKFLNFILYIFAEIAIAACDLAEVLGMAIGIQLLTGLDLIWGVSITVLDTFLLLYLQRLGMRKMEAFIIGLVGVVTVAFFIEVFLAAPDVWEIANGLIPSLPDSESLYIAIGIIGATVMPHNLYLHSALVQSRKINRTDEGIKQAIRFNRVDTTIALNVAFLVNAAILILAATVFYKTGNSQVAEIQEAYRLLPGFLGNMAPLLFAIALIAAGQSSTITGTLAGQIIMEGYLRLRINPIARRLITRIIAIIPVIIVIIVYGEEEVNALLILSQVILSLQLGFAVIPLIHFVSDRSKMGKFAINSFVKIVAWAIAALLIYLNVKMLLSQSAPIIESHGFWIRTLIFLGGLLFTGLLIYITLEPIWRRRKTTKSINMHPETENLVITVPHYNKIAIALDFSSNDEKLISYAIGQGDKDTSFFLVHIVESASANLWGNQSFDYETQKDQNQLDDYINQLTNKGFLVTGSLGFRNRAREIVRLTEESNADILVMGSHGHKGIKDLLFGQTANTVRHKIKIPVFMVRV